MADANREGENVISNSGGLQPNDAGIRKPSEAGTRKRSIINPDLFMTTGGLQPSETAICKMSVVNPNLPQLLYEAKYATHVEKSMTILQAFKTYPKAVMFSMILSTGIIMEGYDVVLLANFMPSPRSIVGTDLQLGIPKTHTKFPRHGKPAYQTGLTLEK
jgi:hypothetical protein